MKIEAAVFPFHERMLPFVRHFNQAQDTYHVCQALAWSGMGLNGQDAAYICRHPNIGIPIVSPTKSESLMLWDALLVDWDELKQSTISFDFFAFFEEFLCKGKKIVAVTKEKDLYYSDGWSVLCHKYPNQICVFSTQNSMKKSPITESHVYRLLSVPVLMVGGLITQEDCLEVILALRESLTRKGEVVSCLTGSNMGLLLGMHSYAHIFEASTGLSAADKAVALNTLAQNIIRAERPSLLIVEAPDPMLKYNNIVPNGFGLQTYLSCQALKPDILVCSVPPDMASEENFLNLISKDFEFRYGVPITAVHVSNVVIDSFDAIQFHKITRVHTDLKQVRSLLKLQNRTQIFPAFDVVSNGAEELAQFLIQKEAILW